METSHPLESSPFAEYAQAIGWVCMQWTNLEAVLNTLLLSLISIWMENTETGLYSITSKLDSKSKIQLAKTLAFGRKQEEEWYKELETVLDYADNELRNKRNRYVHDLWFIEDERIKKLQFIKLEHPEVGKPLELTTLEITDVTVSEIWATADAMDETARKIESLAQQCQMTIFHGSRPPMIDTISSS